MNTSDTTKYQQSAPTGDAITDYDRRCFKLYLMLLEADSAGKPWDKAYQLAFGADPKQEMNMCRTQYIAHLKRARWLSTRGYKQLL